MTAKIRKKNICLLVLIKNELQNLQRLYDEIYIAADGISADVIFVDGKSIDGTAQFLAQKGANYIVQNRNGRGAGASEGIKTFSHEAFILFSPDGNENLDDLPRFIEFYEKGNDLVIATRMGQGARNEEDDQIFKPRKWANNYFNFLANLFFNKSSQSVTDSINGYRLISKALFEKLSVSPTSVHNFRW